MVQSSVPVLQSSCNPVSFFFRLNSLQSSIRIIILTTKIDFCLLSLDSVLFGVIISAFWKVVMVRNVKGRSVQQSCAKHLCYKTDFLFEKRRDP